MNNAFFAFLARKDVEYKRSVRLSLLSSVRIGGIADVVLLPDSEEKLISVLDYLNGSCIGYRVLGRLTNVLVPDEGYRGVIILTSRLNSLSLSCDIAEAGCGLPTARLVAKCADSGLGGIEGLQGIPGSVGGAVYSNAGAFGCEIGDFLVSVRAYSHQSRALVELCRDELALAYRSTVFKQREYEILSVKLALCERPIDLIYSDIQKYKQLRRNTQPYENPSLGSIFKRVGDVSAGYYIDRCGLKGYRIGDAMVSHKHAGFIVNVGAASFFDFARLINLIKEKVYEKFAVNLVEEIEYI